MHTSVRQKVTKGLNKQKRLSRAHLLHKAQEGIKAVRAVNRLCCQDKVVAVGKIQLLLKLPQVAPVSRKKARCTAPGSALQLNAKRMRYVHMLCSRDTCVAVALFCCVSTGASLSCKVGCQIWTGQLLQHLLIVVLHRS